MVVARDRKHHADVKCEKHRFPRTLPMIFDRLSRHLGFSNLARLISRVSNLGLLYLWLNHMQLTELHTLLVVSRAFGTSILFVWDLQGGM